MSVRERGAPTNPHSRESRGEQCRVELPVLSPRSGYSGRCRRRRRRRLGRGLAHDRRRRVVHAQLAPLLHQRWQTRALGHADASLHTANAASREHRERQKSEGDAAHTCTYTGRCPPTRSWQRLPHAAGHLPRWRTRQEVVDTTPKCLTLRVAVLCRQRPAGAARGCRLRVQHSGQRRRRRASGSTISHRRGIRWHDRCCYAGGRGGGGSRALSRGSRRD